MKWEKRIEMERVRGDERGIRRKRNKIKNRKRKEGKNKEEERE